MIRFVEYETMADLRSAVEKLDNREFKGATVHCISDVYPPFPPPYDDQSSRYMRSRTNYQSPSSFIRLLVGKRRGLYIQSEGPAGSTTIHRSGSMSPDASCLSLSFLDQADSSQPQEERPRDRFRSRSPGPRAGGRYPPGPQDDYYGGRRGGDRGFSPRRDDYRRRSPPRDYYGGRDDRYGRPPSRGPPRGRDDYGGPPRRYDDPYPPPSMRGGGGPPYDDPYVNGNGAHGRPYAGGPPSPRRRSPGRAPPYDGGYEGAPPRRYW